MPDPFALTVDDEGNLVVREDGEVTMLSAFLQHEVGVDLWKAEHVLERVRAIRGLGGGRWGGAFDGFVLEIRPDVSRIRYVGGGVEWDEVPTATLEQGLAAVVLALRDTA